MKQKYPIGTKYLPAGKHPQHCTVTDFMTVTNSKGEVVKTYYQSTHGFAGQVVTNREVPHSTVARGVERYRINVEGTRC